MLHTNVVRALAELPKQVRGAGGFPAVRNSLPGGPACMYRYLSIHLSIYPSIYLSIYLSVSTVPCEQMITPPATKASGPFREGIGAQTRGL